MITSEEELLAPKASVGPYERNLGIKNRAKALALLGSIAYHRIEF